jgi:hypothetical protein
MLYINFQPLITFGRKLGSKDKKKRNLGAKTVRYQGVKYLLSPSKPSSAKNKKRYRLVTNTATGKTKKVNYGNSNYDNYGNGHRSEKRRNNYLTRSAGIRDKNGELTKDNPMSSNFLSRSDLW